MSSKERLLESAKKLLDKGAVDKAILEYRKAADADPKDTRTWLRIAELEVKRGRNAEATQTYLRTAELYTEQGFFQRAVAVYKNVLKLSPGLVEAHFKLADLFRQLGLLSDAMQQYEAAAAVYQREGKVAEALDAMRRIVDLNPDHVMSRIKLAEAASAAGQKDEAIAEFQRAAEHLKLIGKMDEYLRVGERLVAHQPDNLDLARELAEGYLERGNGRFALAKLQPCFTANPRDVRTLGLLSKAFEQLGQIGKTVSVLKELAHIHREEGREAEALATYQRIVALDPSEVEARNEVARAHAVSVRAAAPSRPRAAAITFSEMEVPSFLLPRGPAREAAPAPSQTRPAAEPARAAMNPGTAGTESEIQRVISECDVFVKYALLERAADHLLKVFDLDPQHVGARERLAYVLLQLGRNAEASTQFAMLADQFRQSDPQRAASYASHAVAAQPEARARVEGTIPGDVPGFSDDEEEILDVDELGGEFIPDPLSDGDGEDPVSLSTSELVAAQPALASAPRPAARAGSPVPTAPGARPRAPSSEDGAPRPEDWAPPTFAEMALPDFAEFAAIGTQSEVSPEELLAADLEQVDGFLAAGLVQEARALLDDLVARHPSHPEVVERRQRLGAASRSTGIARPPGGGGSATAGAEPRAASAPPPRSTPAQVAPAGPAGPPVQPRAIVAGGGAADSRTAADLGLAYKDMGLYDAAIKEFARLQREPGREVYALIMMGECYEAKGALAEAVVQYKKALNRPGVTDAETTQLYYSLGKVFEALHDAREALYFFDKVVRRDPELFDVRERIARLRRAG